jgi:hypothetical protein
LHDIQVGLCFNFIAKCIGKVHLRKRMKKKISSQFIIQAILVVVLLLYAVLAFTQPGKRNTNFRNLPNIIYIYADDRRTMLMSGNFEDGTEGGQMPLPEGLFTVPKMLKQVGYTTGMTGKWGLGMAGTTGSPLNHGFDYYYSILDQKQAHNFHPTRIWENDQELIDSKFNVKNNND